MDEVARPVGSDRGLETHATPADALIGVQSATESARLWRVISEHISDAPYRPAGSAGD